MSLRARITSAATLAVAALAIALGVVFYATTRSNLIGNVQQQLRSRVQPIVHGGAPGSGVPGGDQGGGFPHYGPGHTPGAPGIGQAPGYFEFVQPDGQARAGDNGTPELPADSRVLAIARSGAGSFFRTATVGGKSVEIYTVADPAQHEAIEVGLDLTPVDSVLHSTLITELALIGGAIILAGLLGAFIARAALAPINEFSDRTERVTTELTRPRRLQETGAPELRRLAESFNATLDALERSIQAQRHLIADASHELRTPMAALRSNIQIFLEADRLPVSEREELQYSIIAELDELTQLVADVLELARGSAPTEHTEPLELDSIVREAIARAQRRASGLQFDVDLEPTVIENTPDRVARAVSNVIDNARKWSPPDGRIEVTLHDGVLAVRDHGPGFNAGDLARVFDRFYRSDEARRRPGSGLGLAIVKQAAEAHGGLAEAANVPDGGAIVRVRFGPAAPTAAPPVPAPAQIS